MITYGIIALLAGLGWVALTHLFKEEPRGLPEQAQPRPEAPRELKVKIVDAGSMRFVDLRAVPKEALITTSAMDGVTKSLAGLEPIACTCFVAAPAVAEIAAELSEVAQVIFWGRFRDAARGSTLASVYVDGAAVDDKASAWAKESRVELLVEWPQIIGTDPATGAPRTWSGREILAS